MKHKLSLPVFFALAFAVVAAAQDAVPWKSKQIAEWSEDDARLVLSESPWAKSVTSTLTAAKGGGQTSGGGGRGRGIGIGGGGISIPGIGGRGMGGRGGRGGRGGGGRNQGGQSNDSSSSNETPKLTVRWESAMPVRSAELKVRDNNAPVIDEKHYAVAVYGVPTRMLVGEAKKLQDQLKKEAVIKRDGKKDFKPSSVEVIDRPDGTVVVYLFAMSTEITRDDHRLEFNAKIGRLDVDQSFFTDDMVWQGKREL